MKQSSTMDHDVSQKRTFSSTVWALGVSLRPYQWVKNTLVFGGLIFSHSMFQRNAVWQSIEAFVVFCIASSSVYLLNDLRDLEEDRRHPVKRLRPLASGALSPTLAATAMVLFFAGSMADAFRLRPAFGRVVVTYLALNVAYSLWLKRVVILDVMIVASGFVFRAIAGAVVIGVVPSPWLILCTMTLALLVGFGKRRHELTLLHEEAQNHRQSLEGYSEQFLDLMMAISAAAALVSYALYTMAEETVRRFGTRRLILTFPWVIYGIFRYLYLIHKRRGGGDPARLFVTDFPTLLNAALWVAVVCFVLYGPTGWWPW
jgi:4-hydroxybenzoate polyprenyltransferase